MAELQQGATRWRLGHIVWLGWMILLIGAAWILPPLDSRSHPHPVAVMLVLLGCVTFLILTCISLSRYFRNAWRNSRTAPNRAEYVIWLTLESLAAVGVVTAALLSCVSLLKR
jgi:hypothetical protein